MSAGCRRRLGAPLARRGLVAALAVVLGAGTGAAWGVASTTENPDNQFSAAPDLTPPTVVRATVAKEGTTSGAGTIRQGGGYRVYASATDAGNPPSGVATVTANTSSFDTGVTGESLTTVGGPWTIDGTSYDYRSGALTADTPLYTGRSYSYSVTATDNAALSGSATYSVALDDYRDVILGTSGLVSYWRMGNDPSAADTFIDATDTTLGSHSGEIAATWSQFSPTFSDHSPAVVTDANRVRRNGTGFAQYRASGTPASANYAVEADLHVKSLVSGDRASVVARDNDSPYATGIAYYRGGYQEGVGWVIVEMRDVLGESTESTLASTAQTLTAGQTYRLRFDVTGTALKLYVDDVLKVSATDNTLSATGKTGVRLGTNSATTAPTNTTGLHLDNFRVVANSGSVVDSKGTNTGSYANGPMLNVPGAIAGDFNGAVRLDGTDDHVSVPDAASLDLGDGPLTLEAWVRRNDTGTTMQTIFGRGTNSFQFGFANSRGRFLKEGGATIADTLSLTNDTAAFHHYVVTKNGATLKLYVDGVDQTGTVTDATLANTATALYMGSRGGSSEFLAGVMDEAAVYNAVLPAATVLDHYRAGSGTG